MFSHVKQEELHNKSSVVQRSLLIVGYSGPSSVSMGGLWESCFYVGEFNRLGLQRKSIKQTEWCLKCSEQTQQRPQCAKMDFRYSFQIVAQVPAFLAFCSC